MCGEGSPDDINSPGNTRAHELPDLAASVLYRIHAHNAVWFPPWRRSQAVEKLSIVVCASKRQPSARCPILRAAEIASSGSRCVSSVHTSKFSHRVGEQITYLSTQGRSLCRLNERGTERIPGDEKFGPTV